MSDLCQGSHCTEQEKRDFDAYLRRLAIVHHWRIQEQVPRAWYVQQALDATKVR